MRSAYWFILANIVPLLVRLFVNFRRMIQSLKW